MHLLFNGQTTFFLFGMDDDLLRTLDLGEMDTVLSKWHFGTNQVCTGERRGEEVRGNRGRGGEGERGRGGEGERW